MNGFWVDVAAGAGSLLDARRCMQGVTPVSHCPARPQVVLLSEGRMLFFGGCGDALAWFSGSLGYLYNPERDGLVPDWLLTVISVGFAKDVVRTPVPVS